MTRTPFLMLAALAFAGLASASAAQEVVQTGDGGAPPAQATAPPIPTQTPPDQDQSPEAIGRWARGVLAGAPAQKTADDAPRPPGARCQPPADRKPHGEVWGGIGTGGYREAGAVVTQPLGDCGSVTIAVDKTEFGGGRRRR